MISIVHQGDHRYNIYRSGQDRTIDLRNMIFYTYDRWKRRVEVNLFDLERQLVDLQNAMGRAFE